MTTTKKKQTKNYDVDYFIQKFEAIPDERWTTGRYRRGDACCALGHCGAMDADDDTDETEALTDVFRALGGVEHNVVKVNDGVGLYRHAKTGDTPKKRILNALRKIKNELQKT